MNNEIKTLGRESNTITIATFYENHLLKKYDFNPSCQRKSIWDEERESFLIDSIMKNFSIPAIFLYQKIDDDTGRTVYDVIDGKQRLQSIIHFIENKIPLPDNYSADTFGDERLNGIYFKELVDDLSMFKKNFWRYNIPVEYIDTESKDIVDSVFDRLNRNGIPLTPQELRNAKFNNTKLFKLINKLTNMDFWTKRFIKTKRMEDTEFISELMLVILEGDLFNAKPADIDTLYEKYRDIENNKAVEVEREFMQITILLEKLELNYKKYNLGVSHIYALWCFCFYCYRNDINTIEYKKSLTNLYAQYRNKNNRNNDNDAILQYRYSLNSGASKSKGQRKRRVQAILDYCETGIKI